MDIWMDVDTALSEVPVNIMPLIDDTDFKTREVAVAYDQAGMDLVWNFCTTVGAMAQTAVTPTTGGTYDWAHQGDGMYTIEIPASGGASINNDTEGFGWFTGFATGVLPWRGPVIGFRAAAINNAMIDGGDLLDVNVTHVSDTAQTANDNGADINAILEDTGTTLPATLATIDGIVDDILVDTGTTLDGKLDTIDGIVDDILVDTGTTIPAALTTIDNELAVVDGIVDSILVDTGTTLDTLIKDIPTVAEFEARTLVAADYTVVSDLGVVQTADHTAAIADIPTVAELEARTLPAADYLVESDTLARVTLVDTTTTNTDMLTAAAVNAEVVDALNVDTYAEPGQGAPAATASLVAKIGYLYKGWRNKRTQTATTESIFDDAGTTVDQKRTVSDDGTTATKGEAVSGP